MRATMAERLKSGRSGKRHTHTHTHRLSAAERLEDRALMAVDVGLAGMGAFGTESTLGTVLFSALSGAGSSTGFVSGASIASPGSPGILPPVPFGSATGGTLAVLPSGTGAPSAGASSAPGSAGGQAAAVKSGPPGQAGAAPSAPPAPVAPPAPGGGAPAPGIGPAGPAPAPPADAQQLPGGGSGTSNGDNPYLFNYDRDGVLKARSPSQSAYELRCSASYKQYLEGRQVLQEIYLEYGRIYLQNPDKQLWAGLATHAGSVVLVEMYDEIERQQQGSLCLYETTSKLCDEMQRLIVTMANAIREDVGKQSAVFGAEGIEGIRRMGLRDKKNVEAWEAIDRGDVGAGAEYLAKREQTDVLNKYYADMARLSIALRPAFSWNAKSGLESFGCPPFVDSLGKLTSTNWMDTDPAEKNDRWKYIRDSILPVWGGMGGDGRTDWVKQRLDIIRNSPGAKCAY
jgi:hypothetical protein